MKVKKFSTKKKKIVVKKRKPPEKISGKVPASKKLSKIEKTPKPKNPKKIVPIGGRASLGHPIEEKDGKRSITKGRTKMTKDFKSVAKKRRKV